MNNMQAFYKKLTTEPKGDNRRLNALTAVTRANRDQLSALSSDLVWQTWGAPTVGA